MKHVIITNEQTKSEIKLPISEDGFALCPVCGEKAENKEFKAYDDEGNPSYGICRCGIEYGYDCNSNSTEKDWDRYRKKWLNEELDFGNSKTKPKSKKIIQLMNIGIKVKT
jgi:hypothetical protein